MFYLFSYTVHIKRKEAFQFVYSSVQHEYQFVDRFTYNSQK